MNFLNRREFLQDSAAIAAAFSGTSLLGSRALGTEEAVKKAEKGDANDTLHVAVIGVNGRGMSHVHGFAGNNNCVVTTICDADEAVIGPAMREVEKKQGKAPKYEKDLRRVMEDKSIDIISTATPNHWHSLIAIWAMQNGKDVYVEKPVSHNVSEGRRMVEAARHYNRICQTGTQIRSSTGMKSAMDYLHSGKLGKVRVAKGICYKLRPSIGKVNGPQAIPKTVDYDLWCGPAPKGPLMRKRLHYDWHWTWDYGNGDLGNQGIHQMDVARWGLGKDEFAKSVTSLGGRFGYVDDGQTANTQICLFDYGDSELIFEVRGWPSRSPYPGKSFNQIPKKPENFVGNIFYCENGILVADGYSGGVAMDQKGEIIQKFNGGERHFDNFVKAVRTRKCTDLNADILEGHLSSALCHLGNISYRLGEEVHSSKNPDSFGDKAASEAFESMLAHLKENNVKSDERGLAYRLGKMLKLDAKTERFINCDAANKMLTREYRAGFVVPEKI